MKYLGNKTKLLPFIAESLDDIGAPKGGVFADLFSGTASVSEAFKKLDFTVISSDIMTYSRVMQEAIIGMNRVPTFGRLVGELGKAQAESNVDKVLAYLNGLTGIRGFFWENFAPGGPAMRQYFTDANAQLVDHIRETIEKWDRTELVSKSEKYYLLACLTNAVDHVANMSGTYGAYLKVWRSVALKRLVLKPIHVYDNARENRVYQEKAEELIKKISGDILYLDPPYNSRQYASNFHVLETLVVWDKPDLHGKTGLRDYSSQKSAFSSKKDASLALSAIIEAAKFNYIALSYNNEGIIPHDEIIKILESKGRLKVFATDYRRFRTERDHEKRTYKAVDDKTTEYLFVVKV